jgi:hypothetical protein
MPDSHSIEDTDLDCNAALYWSLYQACLNVNISKRSIETTTAADCEQTCNRVISRLENSRAYLLSVSICTAYVRLQGTSHKHKISTTQHANTPT